MSQENLGLFDTPPDRLQIRVSLVVAGLLFATFLAILPIRDIRLGEVEGFIPTVDAIMFVGLLITATLLFAQASLFRSRALTVLAAGYVFTAVLLISHVLTFPGAFAPNGLLGAQVNTIAWITLSRRVAFSTTAIAYVLLKRSESVAQTGMERPAAPITLAVIAAITLAAAVTLLATIGHDWLPPMFRSRSDVIPDQMVAIESASFALFLIATIMLFRARSSVLDMWLLVAFAGWLIQSLLIMLIPGRFTAGWYGLYAVTVVAHLVVMFALIAESNRLYARLARSTSERNRERDARLMSMDAVAAAFSHEIGQPLTGVRLNASGSLKWLTRPEPDVDNAIKSLDATIDAGQRAAEIMKSIRSIFAKGPGTASDFNLNDLVRETSSLMDRELAGEGVSLSCALDENLPPIRGNRVQMQQVLVNLFTNAIESMHAVRGRPRRIAIRSAVLDGGDVLLEFKDSGIGIAPEEMARILDAFYTTKETGIGLGLSLCRTIVEEHGGRLWALQGEEPGATLHMQLPRSRVTAH